MKFYHANDLVVKSHVEAATPLHAARIAAEMTARIFKSEVHGELDSLDDVELTCTWSHKAALGEFGYHAVLNHSALCWKRNWVRTYRLEVVVLKVSYPYDVPK